IVCADGAPDVGTHLFEVFPPVAFDDFDAAELVDIRAAARLAVKLLQPRGDAPNDGFGHAVIGDHVVQHALFGQALHQYGVIDDAPVAVQVEYSVALDNRLYA